MRYLETYKLFEALRKENDITSDINDILVDLKDDGFEVWCEANSRTAGDIHIEIWKNTIDVNFDAEWVDLKSTVMRIFDYMESKEYKLWSFHFETSTERNFLNPEEALNLKGRITEYDNSDDSDHRYMDASVVKDFLESLPDNKIFVVNELQSGIFFTFVRNYKSVKIWQPTEE